MPRPNTKADLLAQGDDPIPVARRIERMQLAQDRHELNNTEVEATLPPCLEIISSTHGVAARVIAAHRMLSIYEMGYPVLSDGVLLFGDLLLPGEIEEWWKVIKRGQALCLTDTWINDAIPQVPGRQGVGTWDFDPNPEAWEQRQFGINAELLMLEQAVQLGFHAVMALTDNPLLPAWSALADSPIVLVTVTEEATTGRDGVTVYVTVDLEVEELTGGAANLHPPIPHDYHRLTTEVLEDALTLTSLIDRNQEQENL